MLAQDIASYRDRKHVESREQKRGSMCDLDSKIQEIDEYWDRENQQLRAMREERDAYDDFIASMDMNK